MVNNTGNTDIHMHLTMESILPSLSPRLHLSNRSSVNSTSTLDFDILYRNSANVTMEVQVLSDVTPGTMDVTLDASSNNRYQESTIEFRIQIS
jgi:hypothetical protein